VRFNKTTTIITAVTVVGTLLGDAPAALAATPEKPTSATYNTARYIEKKNKGKEPAQSEDDDDGTVDGPHEIREINWDLRANSWPSGDDLASQYNTMINTLRANAGDIIQGTPVRDTTRNRNRILVINVNLPGTDRPLTLYYSGPNMYLRGWGQTTSSGVIRVRALSADDQYDLEGHLSSARYGNQHNYDVYRTSFPVGYHDLERMASERGAIQGNPGEQARRNFNRDRLINNLGELDRYGNPLAPQPARDIARALLNIIGATSEAARFGGVSAVVTDALRDPNRSTHTLPDDTYNLEPNWEKISLYGWKVNKFPGISGMSYKIKKVGEFYTWHDVVIRAALLMGTVGYAKKNKPGKQG
jgi:hypothetical protein